MSDDSDFQLDAQLRDVPLPEGLLARLRAVGSETESEIKVWSNANVDSSLLGVEVPLGLLARCKRIALDEPLDLAMCEVALPSGLLPSLREIPRETLVRHRAPSKLRRRLANWSLAASLAILIAGGYLGVLAGILSPLRRSSEPAFTLLVENLGPLELTAESESVSRSATFVALAAEPAPESTELPESYVALYQPTKEPRPSGPAGQWLAEIEQGLRPWEDTLPLRFGPLFGSTPPSDRLAEFVSVLPNVPRGIEPPAVRGFDRRFLLRQGVQPVVFPAVHESLRTVSVPLSTGTASFDLTQRRLAEGRWPQPADVRVEDFLAAVDYRFPTPAPGGVGLNLAAGPSIFGQPLSNIPSAGLVQVGASVGAVPYRKLAATHLVVGLDASSAMQLGGRFEAARQGVRWLAGQLGPRDRLSLVVFHDRDVHTAETLGRDNLGQLLYTLERLEPRGELNLAAGVRESLSLALRNELDERLAQRVALLTSGGAALPDSILGSLRDLAGEAASHDVGLALFDMQRLTGGDPTLAALAAAGRGDVRLVDSADDLRWALFESLTGNSSVVAADATLRVVFNPRAVAAYRLLGHEPNALSGATPARVEADLRAGQTATALFEVWLLPGSEDHVAQIEMEWRDSTSGERQIERKTLGRLQFAATFAESSQSLQQAALAAETAEVLRESVFVQGRPRSVQHVLEATKSASYELSRQTDFRRFVSFLKDLEKARLKRSD